MKSPLPRLSGGAICSLLALTTLASVAQAQNSWAGYTPDTSRWVFTEPGFLGWVWTGILLDQNWIYPRNLGEYVYLPQSYVEDNGAWAYSASLSGWDIYEETPTSSWAYSHALKTWFYRDENAVGQDQGWVYIWNSAFVEVSPIVVNVENTANFTADTVAETYANSLRISPAEIPNMVDTDPDIVTTKGEDGITFRNAASRGNQYVRIAMQRGTGLLDLSALGDVSGKIGADVLADVDLSATTSGFYVRLKDANGDVSTNHRLSGGDVVDDIVLQTSLTTPANEVYLEITVPWQGSVTVKDIYLYMEDVVTGFAGMEEKITGGQGAPAENIYTVNNATELYNVYTSLQGAEEPSIINIAGTVTYDEWVIASGDDAREITLGTDRSNISIIGVNDQAMFDGLGITLQGTNYIIQDLTVRYVLARDAISVNNATYVWIDHCTLYNESLEINPDKDKYDELISIKNNAQFVILSWNHLYDSHKTILVGSNDEVEAIPDRKVIMHHNWLQNSGSRLPLYRGGYAHIYNNFYDNIDSGINHRTKSQILIENNYFKDAGSAIGYWFDDVNPSGRFEVSGNIYENVDGGAPTEEDSTVNITFEEGYTYELDDAADVPQKVMDGSGVREMVR
ncbi:MAG: hypothetical protein Q7P63_08965 [Verrucomicrobiota bacterium JB022]|nr:hypothetical protein [Verrucomicrobiota bacterium JB022]